MLSRVAEFVGNDTTARKEAISDEFARGLGQDYEGRRYREPPAPDAQELGIRRQAMAGGASDGDSTDELRNYALLQRQRRMGGAPPAVDSAARTQRYASFGSGLEEPAPAAAAAPVDPAKAAQLAELEQAKLQAIEQMNAAPPAPVDPAKAALMAELEREGNRTAAEIGAIGTKAPGTARGVSQQLEQRRREILSRLATPAATGGANAPQLSQPPPMAGGQAPIQAYPQVAAAPAIPTAPPRPVATFPLIAPPVYPQSPVYPTPGQPQVTDLDRAAAAEYARTRLGTGGP